MFRQKSGISPTALLIGSSLVIAALSPEIRRKISGMMSGQMNQDNKTGHKKDGSMQPAELIKQAFGGDTSGQQQHQQHTDRSQHKQGGSMQPAEFIKQAFGGDSGEQQQASQSQHKTADSSHTADMNKQSYSGRHSGEHTNRRKEPSAKSHYTEPIHFEESAVNVLNDSTVMNMLEDLEPGTH
ncbi:hypothetical protein J7E20_11845 [Bacillus sp. ISL-26]|uniref:hypothetical protein n=1 Tax=Bacillus sp. ISL-26 TaxID=2819119 RepID=UPI001BE7D01E|nr:hypothetical protein [Bacillus sp. ISL-26]MBT2635217.1 hypothetical protein [Bacillus sp. ISL-26]